MLATAGVLAGVPLILLPPRIDVLVFPPLPLPLTVLLPFYAVCKPCGRLSPFFAGVGGWLLALSAAFKLIPSYTDIFRYIDSVIYIEAVVFLLPLGRPRPLPWVGAGVATGVAVTPV